MCSPEDGVSLWEWVTFSFVEPILDLATKRAKTAKLRESPNITIASEGLVSGAITPVSTIVASSDQLGADPHLATAKRAIEIEDDNNEALDNQFGPRRTLSEEDIWSLPPSFLHRNVFQKHLSERSR